MLRSVMFRVYDRLDNVIYAEVRNYKCPNRGPYISKHAGKLLRTIAGAEEVRVEYPDQVLEAGIWLHVYS